MTREAPLRAAVVGLGRMGMHHVRACNDSDQISLVAVLDHKPDWAVQVGAEYHCLVAADLDGLIGKVDLAIIAVPTSEHKDTALALLDAGISCLVEKPVAATETDAQSMLDMANARDAALCVGHVERFNPAVMALTNVLGSSSPISRLESRRLNAPSDRTYDVDSVLDLMIHDLDLLNVLAVGEPADIAAQGRASSDYAKVLLKLTNGAEAHLEVSRESKEQCRDLTIIADDVVYELDFADRTLTLCGGESEVALSVSRQDPLRAQLAAFVDIARGLNNNQIASGRAGLEALSLANKVRVELGLL